MAVKFYVGIPRSGKTYKAMTVLYYTFVDTSLSLFLRILIFLKLSEKPKPPFINAYTNINQFNFDISDKINPFCFDEIFQKLTQLHALYLEKKSDEELIEKAKELNIYNSLFVIDEAHNFFNAKDNIVLIWWITYHAHLHQELILITQDLSLINTEYKRTAEYFYRAVPARFRMSKNTFKYIQYSTHAMAEKDQIKGSVEKVKANKKIFDLYVSGADTSGKSILHKYIAFALVALIACFASIYSFFGSIAQTDENIDEDLAAGTKLEAPQKQTSTTSTISKNDSHSYNEVNENQDTESNLKLFKFNCFETMCNYKTEKENIRIPSNILKSYLLDIKEDNKYIHIQNKRLYIYVLVNENRFSFITNSTKGVQDENENINPIGFN